MKLKVQLVILMFLKASSRKKLSHCPPFLSGIFYFICKASADAIIPQQNYIIFALLFAHDHPL
jgi:hypothetical protein